MGDNGAGPAENGLLTQARRRLRSPSGSCRALSRQELAEAVNAYLWTTHRDEDHVNATYVGHLEQGKYRWPRERRREAFRHVLGVSTDAEIGFYIMRGLRSESATDTVETWPADLVGASCELREHMDGDMDRRALLKTATLGAGIAVTPRALLWRAAHHSAALSAAAEGGGLGPTTLEHARDDLRRLTTDYVVTSDLPRILGETLLLRDRLTTLIDQRTARLRDARELHVMMGATCLLLASISHDAGESDAGMMQARAAETYADLAEHPELLGWVLCTKAMIDLWRQRPTDVLVHAERGEAVAVPGSAGLRLKGLRVRALAQLNRKAEATTLIRQITPGNRTSDHTGTMADYGSVFSFPESRQHYYAAASYTYLGDYAAVESAVAALGHNGLAPAGGTWPVSWALSRSYLALARLGHGGSSGGPPAATQALAPVLTLPKVQRINQLDQVLIDIGHRLRQPTYRNDATAAALGDAIRDFRLPMPAITAS